MAVTSSITAKPGRQFLLKVMDESLSPPAFVTVGGLRNTSMTLNNNPLFIGKRLTH